MNEAEPKPEAKARKPQLTKGPKIASGSAEQRRTAAAILEVLGGARTPPQAAQALGMSLMKYYLLEKRALSKVVEACGPQLRGPRTSPEKQIATLQRQVDRLSQEAERFRALARVAARSVGLAPPAVTSGKKRRRAPVVRALRAAHLLRSAPDETGGLQHGTNAEGAQAGGKLGLLGPGQAEA